MERILRNDRERISSTSWSVGASVLQSPLLIPVRTSDCEAMIDFDSKWFPTNLFRGSTPQISSSPNMGIPFSGSAHPPSHSASSSQRARLTSLMLLPKAKATRPVFCSWGPFHTPGMDHAGPQELVTALKDSYVKFADRFVSWPNSRSNPDFQCPKRSTLGIFAAINSAGSSLPRSRRWPSSSGTT